jgi:ComEC/Rec2-related protein
MRTELERRPLLILCCGLIVGLTAVEYPVNALFALAFVLVLRPMPSRMWLAAGFALGASLGPRIPTHGLAERKFVDATAQVLTVPKLYPDGSSFEASVNGSRLLVRYRGAKDVSLGDEVHLRGLAKPFSEGFEALYLHRLLVGRMDVEDRQLRLVAAGPTFFRLGVGWRRGFVDFCSRTLPPDIATAVDALCFNVDGGLDTVTRQSLQTTGTMHIISASGLQVMLFAFALQGFLCLFPIPRSVQLGILVVVLMLYAAATGMRPTVLRAVIMTLLFFGAYLVRREPDLLAALATVATVFLLWKPEGVYDIGFQFSFITVAALGLFGAQRGRSSQLRKVVRGSLIASLAAAPLTAAYFGLVSIVSLPANLLVVPAVGPIVVGSLSSYAVNPLLPGLASWLMAAAVAPLTGWIYWVLGTFGGLSWSSLSTPAIGGYWLVAFYCGCLALWRKRVRRA